MRAADASAGASMTGSQALSAGTLPSNETWAGRRSPVAGSLQVDGLAEEPVTEELMLRPPSRSYRWSATGSWCPSARRVRAVGRRVVRSKDPSEEIAAAP